MQRNQLCPPQVLLPAILNSSAALLLCLCRRGVSDGLLGGRAIVNKIVHEEK